MAERGALRRLLESAPQGPWKAMIEGRDHVGGDSFIMAGPESSRYEGIYVSLDGAPAPVQLLDFIAEARNALPLLLDEIELLSGLTPDSDLP